MSINRPGAGYRIDLRYPASAREERRQSVGEAESADGFHDRLRQGSGGPP
jgi:hypothetical protein